MSPGSNEENVSQSQGQDDWTRPRPDTVPRPTFAPAAMAFGLTLSFWGVVTSPVILIVGLVVVAFALAGWISEMRHEA